MHYPPLVHTCVPLRCHMLFVLHVYASPVYLAVQCSICIPLPPSNRFLINAAAPRRLACAPAAHAHALVVSYQIHKKPHETRCRVLGQGCASVVSAWSLAVVSRLHGQSLRNDRLHCCR